MMATRTAPREFEHLTDLELADLLDDPDLTDFVKFDLHGEVAHRQVKARSRTCR
jgi:hypothetical protein